MPQPRLPSGFEQHIVEPAGLDLGSDPLDSDCLIAFNVRFTDVGRVEARPGYRTFAESIQAANSALVSFYHNFQPHFLYRLNGTQWRAVRPHTSTGAPATVTTYTTGGTAPAIISAAHVGTPTAAATYLASAVAGSNYGIRKYDGATFTAPAGTAPTPPTDPDVAQIASYTDAGTTAGSRMPACAHVAVTPWGDNRLVAARIYAPTSEAGESRVMFSAAGKPETWQVDHFVDLNPGDSEHIQAMVAWRDKLYVFKRSTFYVFYGASANSQGLPEFLYTPYASRSPMRNFDQAASGSIAKAVAGQNGVYYIGSDGIYRTTGQDPVKVSRQLDPFFAGTAIPHTLTAPLAPHADTMRIAAWEGYVIVSFETGGEMSAYVLHENSGQWAQWKFLGEFGETLCGFAVYRDRDAVNQQSLAFLTNKSDSPHGRIGLIAAEGFAAEDDQAATGSDGTAFPVAYSTGLLALGTTDEKVVREVFVEATVNADSSSTVITVGTDIDPSPPTASTLSLVHSVHPSIEDRLFPQVLRHRRSYRGRWFQVQLTSLACSVNRLIVAVGSSSGPSSDA